MATNIARNLCLVGTLLLAVKIPATAQTAPPATVPPQASTLMPAPTLAFDVVSVKQNKSGRHDMSRLSASDSDGITLRNVPLMLVVLYAYWVNNENLAVGIPDWAMAERYDITAKVASSDVAAYQKLTNRQHGQMIQTVLADRFQLKVHRETRDKPVYALTVAKGGSKMKEAKPGDTSANGVHPSGDGMAHGATIFTTGPGQLTAQAAGMGDLAVSLSNSLHASLGRDVIDKTGLTAKYDFTLQIAPDQLAAKPDNADGQPQNTPGSDAPSIFAAIQEQLGLKLQSATAPTEYLVVDHIEHPTEN